MADLRKSKYWVFFILIGLLLTAIAFRNVIKRRVEYHPQTTRTGERIEQMFKDLARGKGIDYPLTNRWVKIRKQNQKLELYSGSVLLKEYNIVLSRLDGIDDKEKEGDNRTPEGEFYICTKNPESKFHLFLGISYPNKEDAERGLPSGLITQAQYDKIIRTLKTKKRPPWDTPLGGKIGIHGGGTNRKTTGCIGLGNPDIEELYQVLQLRDKVVIEK